MAKPKKHAFKITDATDSEEVLNVYNLNRARKMANEADLKGEQKEIEKLKKEKLKGTLIPLKEAQEIFSSVGAQTKSRMERLLSQLPQKLEGLPAVKMLEVLRESFYKIHSDLYSDFSVKEVEADSITLLKDDGEAKEGTNE